jgi:hypothetical protein
MVKRKKQQHKLVDKVNEQLENTRVNPTYLMASQIAAAWLYIIFRVLWFIPEIIFGNDACTKARNKLNEKLNN